MNDPTEDGTDDVADPVLETLLRERLGGAPPPDLTDAVVARHARGDAGAAARQLALAGAEAPSAGARVRWLAAATILFGLGIVVAIFFATRSESVPAQQPDRGTPTSETPASGTPIEARAQDPAGPASFELRVVDRHGAPIQDFTMQILGTTHSGRVRYAKVPDRPEVRLQPRDFGGDFTPIRGLGAGRYVVLVKAEPHVMALSKPFTLRPEEPAPRITVHMGPGGELRGVVQDADGRPVAGAAVRTRGDLPHTASDAPAILRVLQHEVPEVHTRATVRTDAEGRFHFSRLTYGEYAVDVEHPDFCWRTLHEVAIGERAATADAVRLERGARIRGFVLVGVVPTSGVEVFIAPVPAENAAAGPTKLMASWTAKTGEGGAYVLDRRLPPGDYDIHARVDQQPGESPFDVLMRVHKSRRKFTIAAGVDEVVLDLAAAAK